MGELVDKIVATTPGRLAFKAVRPLVHLWRRIRYPGIPSDHQITNVSYRDKSFAIFHRRTSQDIGVIHQCFGQAQYNTLRHEHARHLDRIFQQIVSSGRQPLIIDCGSNIGASVLWFNARYPRAHIVAIEPAPDNLALLKRNIVGLDVDLIEGGISGSDGTAQLLATEGGSYAYRTVQFGGGIDIRMYSIPSILATKPPSIYTPFILKVDIEGSEQSLFSGDTSHFHSFPLILMEPHDWMLPGQFSSQPFFRFHANSSREFAMKHEIVASIDVSALSLPTPQVEAGAATH